MSAFAPPAPRATLLREIGFLLPLAIPLILGQLFGFGTDVVSTLLAGHLGASVLAAVSVGTSLWIVIFMIIVGLMMSVQPTVAQLDGAGRRAATAGVFRQGVILGLSIGLLAAVTVAIAGPSLAAALGVPAKLLPMASGFLRAATLSFPALGLLSACRGFSEGLSRTRPTMVCGAIGLLMLGPVGLWADVWHSRRVARPRRDRRRACPLGRALGRGACLPRLDPPLRPLWRRRLAERRLAGSISPSFFACCG